MNPPTIKNVALVGAGIIGRGWIPVFTKAGCRLRIYDKDSSQAQRALTWLENELKLDIDDGFIDADEAEKRLKLISLHDDLVDTLAGAGYIQENCPEDLSLKKSIFFNIDQIADEKAIIASSTSGLDINQIADGLKGASRCITAHPCNPPHVIPVVEVLTTQEADSFTINRAVEFLVSLGQKPVLLKFYVLDFLLNRIQSAVVREAIHLVESGVAEVDAVDTVICEGLGLRWALLGPFGVNNTNADGGIREYYKIYGESYKTSMADLDSSPPSFNPEMIEKIAQAVDTMEGYASISSTCRWRDRMVRKIRDLKEKDPHPRNS